MRISIAAAGLGSCALLMAIASAGAGELRLSDGQLDGVTAGENFSFLGNSTVIVGPNDNFEPIGQNFGAFEVFEGPLNEPAPPPPPPVVPGPGGGGFNLGNLIAALLGLR